MSSSLREVAVDAPPVEVRGAFELDRTPSGLLPRRLPAWTRSQIPDLFMNTMVALPSGVRLAFATDSPVVELTVHTRTVHTVGSTLRVPVFQMTVDGELQADMVVEGGSFVHVDRTQGPEGVSFENGSARTLRWDGLAAGLKAIEIWLPTNASVEVQSLCVDAAATVSQAPSRPVRWTHYGSSISHCMDVDRPFDAWPAQVARRTGVELTSFALAGQCQLDPFMGRVIGAHPADLISLKLGINLVNANSMNQRTFTPAVHGLLDSIRDRQPDTPLVVCSPIACPMAEDHPGPTVPQADGGFCVVGAPAEVRPSPLTLRWIRGALEFLVLARREAGDTNLHYLDGLSLFGVADAHLLYDGLHPTPEGYALLGRCFEDAAFGPSGPIGGPFGGPDS